MRKPMTDAQRWRAIGLALEGKVPLGDDYLCWFFAPRFARATPHDVPAEQGNRMERVVFAVFGDGRDSGALWNEEYEVNRTCRIMSCEILAAMADADGGNHA